MALLEWEGTRRKGKGRELTRLASGSHRQPVQGGQVVVVADISHILWQLNQKYVANAPEPAVKSKLLLGTYTQIWSIILFEDQNDSSLVETVWFTSNPTSFI